jgi:acyl carrier protein
MLELALRERVGRVLGVATEKLDPGTPLSDVGLDSLMAIELRNWVEGDLRVNLPAVELLKGPSIMQLVDHLAEQLGEQDGSALTTTMASTHDIPADVEEIEEIGERQEAAALLSQFDDLSDEQVDALLQKMDGGPRGAGG